MDCGVFHKNKSIPWLSFPNVACYQLHYTRIFGCHDYSTKLVRFKVFPVCSHSCGQSDFTARFVNVVKSRKCPYSKDLCGLSGTVADEVRTAPKAGALPTALHPVIQFVYPAGRILPNHPLCQSRWFQIFVLVHYSTVFWIFKVFSVCNFIVVIQKNFQRLIVKSSWTLE